MTPEIQDSRPDGSVSVWFGLTPKPAEKKGVRLHETDFRHVDPKCLNQNVVFWRGTLGEFCNGPGERQVNSVTLKQLRAEFLEHENNKNKNIGG